MTLDGRTSKSDGNSRWITNPESRRYAHKLRSFSDAVLIGIDTAIHDNPALSIRIAGFRGRQPIRIIVDSQLKIPQNALCISDTYRQSTIIATTRNADKRKIETLRSKGCTILLCRNTKNGISMRDLLAKLASESVQSILVEGGRKIAGSLIRERLVNKIVAFISPKIIGGHKLTSPITGWEAPSLDLLQLKNIQIKKFGHDISIEGYPTNPYLKEKK
jgi:diaminohydroxyphosphoribosylaminopyrimidine deaminase/5-amino-6-(5-phosphoribosylamino)uracil reductase